MKRRAFLLNSTVILLIVPLLLLLATYEDASHYIIQAQSERVLSEKTYDVISYVQLDFQRALEISGKRAIVAIVDSVVNSNIKFDGINETTPLSDEMVNNTIRNLILNGTSGVFESGYLTLKKDLIEGQTLPDWEKRIAEKLKAQGYNITIRGYDITVAPLDSFRVVIKARIKNATITTVDGKVVYNGPIPMNGWVYSIIDIRGLEDPLFAVATGGRYSRIVQPCTNPFPEVMGPPVHAIAGNGQSDMGDHVVGNFSTTFTLSPSTIRATDTTYITDLTQNPLNVFNKSGIGVLVFDLSGEWCDDSMKYRAALSVPALSPGTYALLKINPGNLKNIAADPATNRAAMEIYLQDGSTCTPVPFWIEEWNETYALIWIKVPDGTGEYYIYYTDDPNALTSGDFVGVFGDYGKVGITLPGAKEYSLTLFKNISWDDFVVRYQLHVSKLGDADAGVGLNFTQSSSCLMVTESIPSSAITDSSQVTDVQLPINLTAEQIAALNATWTENEAAIEVTENGTPVPFWIEKWDSSGARIWVKANLSLVGDNYTAVFEICPTSSAPTRGDPQRVFEFFEDFEDSSTWPLWEDYGRGELEITSSYHHSGDYAILKLSNNDPNGGYRDIGKTLGRDIVLEYWDERVARETRFWGPYDRVGLIDDNGNGYGALINVYSNYLGIDKRTSYRGNARYSRIGTLNEKTWYFIRFTILKNGKLIAALYDASGNLLGTYTRTDSSYSTFTRVYIFGGHDYAVDDIRIRKYIPLDELSENVEVVPIREDYYQFIDDNFNNDDHGGDKLAILKNWTENIWNRGGTWNIVEPKVYEVDASRDGDSVTFKFVYEPNRDGSLVSWTPSPVPYIRAPDVTAVVDNTDDNNVTIDWLFVIPGYTEVVATVGTPEAGYINARAYDITSLLTCVMEHHYIGTYSGMSFFERLELSRVNHDKYVKLAEEMQREMGYLINGNYYPIGLISFLTPGPFDEKLTNLLNQLSIPVSSENESSVDYYFLNRYFGDGQFVQGYAVWGISYGTCTDCGFASGNLDVNRFYLDYSTALIVLGPDGVNDLLKR